MKTRAITALFFVTVMVASMLLDQHVFAVFFVVLSAYCLGEFYRIIGDNSAQPNRLLGLVLGSLGFGLFAGYRLFDFDARYLLLPVPLIASVFILPLYQKHEKPFGGIAYTLLGLAYVVLPFIAF